MVMTTLTQACTSLAFIGFNYISIVELRLYAVNINCCYIVYSKLLIQDAY